MGTVAAFYPADEPNVSLNETPAEISTALQQAISAIRARFPGIPIGVVYAWGSASKADYPNYIAISSFD